MIFSFLKILGINPYDIATGTISIKLSIFSVVILCLLNPKYLRAQGDQFQIEDLVTVPKTPEAFAFEEYANSASVSQYSGKASVNVPIASLSGYKLSQAVSLTYQTGGIRVQQEAGIVGLGWNLNVGGMITRNINGLPDDYSYADWNYYPHYSEIEYNGTGYSFFDAFMEFQNNDYSGFQSYSSGFVELYHIYRKDATSLRQIDTQPDTYSFSAGDLSGTLFIDYESGTAYCIEQPDLKVQVTIGSGAGHGHGVREITYWEITDTRGNVYEFGHPETTRVHTDGSTDGRMVGQTREYTSGWYLEKISNPYLTDEFVFQYSSPILTSNYSMVGSADSRENPFATPGTTDAEHCGTFPSVRYGGTVNYSYSKRVVEAIRVNGITRVQFAYGNDRVDLTGQKHLIGVDVMNVLGETISQIDLSYDYFGTSNPSDDYESRLKLDAVQLYGDDLNETPQTYSFIYDDTPLPPRNSFAQDYWGFYNGATNTTLVPRNDQFDDASSYTANRQVNSQVIEAGTLRSVFYPTGGRTTFTYAPNTIYDETFGETEVTVKSTSLQGGTYTDDPFGYYQCDDASAGGAPYFTQERFPIHESDLYTIKINVAPGNPSTANQIVAIKQNGTTLCDVLNPEAGEFLLLDNATLISGEVQMTLEPGLHSIFLLNDQPAYGVSVEISHVVTDSRSINRPVSGLKVVRREDRDETGKIAKAVHYRYNNVVATSNVAAGILNEYIASSGELHQGLMYEEVTDREVLTDGPMGSWTCQYLYRSASNRATPTPNTISYSWVSEMVADGEGNVNGATIYEFFNENEGVGDRPYSKTHAENGMIKTRQVYKVNDAGIFDIQVEEHNVYEKIPLGNGITGFDFISNESSYSDILIKLAAENSDLAQILYHPTIFTSVDGNPPRPTPCTGQNNPDNDPLLISCYNFQLTPLYSQRPYGISDYWLRQSLKSSTQYENGEELTVNETFAYDQAASGQFQLKSVTTETANDRQESIHYFYPSDMAEIDASVENMSVLIGENRVATPVRLEKRIDNSIQSVKNTVYDAAGRPEIIQIAHGSANLNDLEDRIVVLAYDANNNITKLRGADGLLKHYVWGYNDYLLIAEIIGEQDNEIRNVLISNPPDDDGGNALSAATHAALKAISGTLVSTYTHDPGKGVTRQTDPNGRNTTYLYDSFGRLLKVIDHEGHVLSQNEYHFANQND